MKNISVRRIEIIVALYIFCIVVAELMGSKTFQLFSVGDFSLKASVAIFVLPVIYSITDIIVEVHGKARARGVVYIGIAMIVLLIMYSTLATALPPSTRFVANEPSYDLIFHASIRISIASLIAFAVAELLDVAIFSKLRQRMQGRALWLRNNLSNFAGFFVDSLIFLTLAFYAFGQPVSENVSFIARLLIPYWLLKCALSVFGTPLVYAGVRWLKSDPSSPAK